MKALKELRSIVGASIKTVAGLFFSAALSTGVAAGKLPYSYFFVGEPAKTPVIVSSDRAATPSYVLMGGGAGR